MDAINIVHGQRLQSLADIIEKHGPATTQPPGVGNPEDNMDLIALFTSRFFLFTFICPIVILVIFGRFFKTNDADVTPPARHNTRVPANKLKKKKEEEQKLPQPSEIVSLRIYPIKSCRGIVVSDAKLLRSGLELDRNWMFVDASNHEFQTIRQNAAMTLIKTSLNASRSELSISVQNTADSVTIPAKPSSAWLKANCKLTRVMIWGAETDGWAYNDAINDMFTAHFEKPVQLIYKGPEPRISAGSATPELYGEAVPHYFADLLSVQIASEASLRDLNDRLASNPDADAEALTIERFRPNIVIRGNTPWEEDSWKKVRIDGGGGGGEKQQATTIDLDIVSRCARCQVPNVNPESAEKNAKEPWNSLMKFRRVDTGGVAKYKPCFGMLAIPKGEGDIRLGGVLEVVETTEKHLYNTTKFEDL